MFRFVQVQKKTLLCNAEDTFVTVLLSVHEEHFEYLRHNEKVLLLSELKGNLTNLPLKVVKRS